MISECMWNAWKKDTFSHEIQNDDIYPTNQTMTLLGTTSRLGGGGGNFITVFGTRLQHLKKIGPNQI